MVVVWKLLWLSLVVVVLAWENVVDEEYLTLFSWSKAYFEEYKEVNLTGTCIKECSRMGKCKYITVQRDVSGVRNCKLVRRTFKGTYSKGDQQSLLVRKVCCFSCYVQIDENEL